jgi:hypothetical protein
MIEEIILESNLTHNKQPKYKKWLSTLPDLDMSIVPYLIWYEQNINGRVSKNLRDVFKFKTTDEFISTIKEIKQPSIKELKSDVFKILDNDNFLVLIPLTLESSKLYGSNTRWCTTQKPSFDKYTNEGVLYYILDRKLDIKLACHIPYGVTKKQIESNKLSFFLSDDEEFDYNKLKTIYGNQYYTEVINKIKDNFLNISREIQKNKFVISTYNKLVTIKKGINDNEFKEFEGVFNDFFKVISDEFTKISSKDIEADIIKEKQLTKSKQIKQLDDVVGRKVGYDIWGGDNRWIEAYHDDLPF